MRTRARCFDSQTERKAGSNHTQSKNDSSHSTHKSMSTCQITTTAQAAFRRLLGGDRMPFSESAFEPVLELGFAFFASP